MLALVVVLVTQTGQPPAVTAFVAVPPLLGGSTVAPRQASGSADGLGPAPDTRTGVKSAPRSAVRPPGAVADRLDVPAMGGRAPVPASRLTNVPVRPDGVPKTGFDARTSVEDPALRDATSQGFRNADGTLTRRSHSEPVHVRRPDGSWASADLTVDRAPDGRWAPRLTQHGVSFGGHADGEFTNVAVSAEHDVAFVLRGAGRVAGEAQGGQVSYRRVLPDTDLVVTATARGPKEELVLHSVTAPSVYEFDLRLRGLTPVLAEGDVRLVDGKGAARAVIPSGWMRDKAGAESRSVHYGLSKAGKDWRLRVTVDRAWLTDSARVFPVTVDPSVWIDADTDDTYVTSGTTANRSGEIQLKAGKEGSGGISAAYLHFPGLATTLANQYITGAALNLYTVDSASCTPKPVDVFAVGAPWSGSTMTRWPGAPLAQHLAQRTFAHGKPGCDAAREAFQLPQDVVTDWTHGTPFHGLSVRAAVEGDPGAFKRFASANTPQNSKPYLDVTYSPQGASYRVEEVLLPTAGHNGQIKATVRNRGSATWTPGGPHKFGFIVKQGATVVQMSPKFAPPHNVAPNASMTLTVPMDRLTPGDYQVYVTMYDGAADYQPTYGVPYGRFDMKVVNVPPSVNHEQPGSGASVDSLTPTLYAEGVDTDNWPNKGLRYNFKICDGPPETPVNCVESGFTGATWSPPRGRLRWSQTYYWWVQAHDTVNAGPFVGPLTLTTRVPQPEITAHLGGTPQGAPAPGLDPQVGNFGMETTDANVATVGPDLTITRTYNSLDPRTDTGFGQGWASRLDTTLRHDEDGSGNELVTLPSGRQVRFGRNADGTYAPPPGQNLTLVLDTATGYYTLRDASGSNWQFNPWGRLRTITDPGGLVEELEYDVAGPSGTPLSVYNHTSKRRLYLTWTGGHVTKVRTDPPAIGASPLEWTYSYEGHRLTSACDPGPAPNCTRYTYQAGSHYRSVVLDDYPRAYYRFGESVGGAGAGNVTARTSDADRGTYTGVALGGPGALAGTADTAAAFDGAAGRVDLPAKLTSPTLSVAVELWFKTTGGGVLASYADKPFGTTSTLFTPILYVGQDGHLRGGFRVPSPTGPAQITSPDPVNDGQWHHAVLSGTINSQVLYLDGVTLPGRVTGVIDHDLLAHLVIGTGRTTGWASGNNGNFFFAGTIDEVAVYQHPLGATAVATHYAARRQVEQLTRVTLPQNDRIFAALTYDDINDRVATLTDHDGRTWRLDNPTRSDALRTVALHGPYPDWIYQFDADNGGRLTARTHDNKTRRYAYNTAGFHSEESDENGHRSTFTTDARGNVLSRTTYRGPGTGNTAYSTYFLNPANPLDPRNDRTLTDSDARSTGPADPSYRTTYGYDTAGRLISATHPRPHGAPVAPTETWKYSLGTEQADGGGTVPAGLLVEHSGRRPGQTTRHSYRATGDLAEQITPTGLRIRYGYDALGRKTSETPMTSAGAAFGTTDYIYTPRSQVDTMTGPPVRNTLAGADHRLQTRYGYDANGNTTQITRTDTTGANPPRTTTHEYNQHDHLVATTLPDGGRETHETRNAGQESRYTDPRGTTWIDYTDSQNRLLRRVAAGPGVDPEDPAATVLTLETRSYDAAGRLSVTRDAMGRETRHTYYDDDMLATTTHSGVRIEQREYDPAGNLTKVTAAGGLVTTATYDPAGNPATTTLDPAGLNRTTTYLRDPDGLVRTETRTGAADPSRSEATTYGYNAAGQLVREDVQPAPGDTLSISYTRDERGLVTQRADRRRLATDYTYDFYGRVVTETKPEVETWVGGQRQTTRPQAAFGHNTYGDRTHQRDPNGALTVLTYDPAGRTTSTRLPDYTPPGGQVIRAVVRTDYDRLGNPTRTTDPLGRVTERAYDPYSRVIAETLPKVGDQPNATTYGYDRNGELLAVTQPSGINRLSTYDNRGRKITDTAVERQPRTTYFTTTYGYDDAGNQTSVTTPAGSISRATYNAAGELTTVTDATGKAGSLAYDIVGRRAATTDPGGVTTRTTYDLLGRETATTQLTGNPPVEQRRWQQTFDPNDNLLTTTSPEGRSRSFGYDADNRLVRQDEKVDAGKTVRTTIGYDPAGNRTRFVDGKGHATTYTHTPWGFPESTVEPGGATWTAVYDAAGQQVRNTAPGNVVVLSDYDAQGRLTVQRGTGAEAVTVDKTFGYTPDGRLAGFGAPGGNTALTYDDRGNLSTTRGPSGDATYTYTADNQIATRADVTGNSSFTYDPAGRISSIVDGLSGRTVDHTYDNAGRLAYTAERGMAQFVKRVNTYDPLGRLTGDNVTEFDPNGGSPRVVIGTEYGRDRDDNVTTKTTIANNQRTATSYGYDGANRLTSSGTTSYEWDDAGNRTRAGATTYTYNDRNQLTSDGTTQYTYTPRGTLATAGAKAPKFDAFDQLIQDGVGYSYDSLGRVAKRGTTAFGYSGLGNDSVSDGARLVSRDVDGRPVADKAVGSADTAKLLYADERGDVVGRYQGVSSFGQRTFDPFGNVTSASGEQPGIGYQGEWTEPTTGAVNMHARWYSPGTGTFVSRDTWTIPPHPSVEANRYTYGAANPVVNIDPTGHKPAPPNPCMSMNPRKRLSLLLLWEIWFGDCAPRTSAGCADLIHVNGHLCPHSWHKCDEPWYWQFPECGVTRGGSPGEAPSCRTTKCFWDSPPSEPGKPGGPGRKPRRPPWVAPPPPPPPLWVINIRNAPPRPGPGKTVRPRPDFEDIGGLILRIVDKSLEYANEANDITVAPQPQLNPRPFTTPESVERDVDREDCLGLRQEPGIEYWPLKTPDTPDPEGLGRGRATGAEACLDSSMLNPNSQGPGFRARYTPRGFVTGQGMARMHGIAGAFYGSGLDPRNIVAGDNAKINIASMWHRMEKCVQQTLRTVPNAQVYLNVQFGYTDTDEKPETITMIAAGSYNRQIVIINDPRARQSLPDKC